MMQGLGAFLNHLEGSTFISERGDQWPTHFVPSRDGTRLTNKHYIGRDIFPRDDQAAAAAADFRTKVKKEVQADLPLSLFQSIYAENGWIEKESGKLLVYGGLAFQFPVFTFLFCLLVVIYMRRDDDEP